jgi:hypothetical protein
MGISGMGRQLNINIAAILNKMDVVRLPNLRNSGPR